MSEKLWEVISSEPILEHDLVSVDLEQVRLPDNRIANLPRVLTSDYSHVFVVNDNQQAMIIEGYKHGPACSTWQLAGGYMKSDENPLTAAQQSLLLETGHNCAEWRHLGSFVVDANRYVGLGHFFLACHPVASKSPPDVGEYAIRWVSLPEVQQALWDGRVACISYAVNISLGLLALSNGIN